MQSLFVVISIKVKNYQSDLLVAGKIQRAGAELTVRRWPTGGVAKVTRYAGVTVGACGVVGAVLEETHRLKFRSVSWEEVELSVSTPHCVNIVLNALDKKKQSDTIKCVYFFLMGSEVIFPFLIYRKVSQKSWKLFSERTQELSVCLADSTSCFISSLVCKMVNKDR